MSKIIFLVDHKYRDLNISSLISIFLENLDHEIKILPLHESNISKNIYSFMPEFLIIPKPNWNFSEHYKYRFHGIKTIVVETEGNHQDKEITYNIPLPPNLYLTWNDEITKKYQSIFRGLGKVLTGGFHRGDFLHNNYINFFQSRKSQFKKLNLQENIFTITIATSTHTSMLTKEELMDSFKRRNTKFKNITDIRDIYSNQLQLREKTVKFIQSQIDKGRNIVLKPHPNERITFWENLQSKIGSKNFKLFPGDSINNLFSISDFHIAHNVCTTIIEAETRGIKTMEITAEFSRKLYKNEHFGIATYEAKNLDEMNFFIEDFINQKNNIAENTLLKDYIKNYFHSFDGNRCRAYAELIDEFILVESSKTFSKFVFLCKNYIATGMYFLLILKRFLNYFQYKKYLNQTEDIIAKMQSKKSNHLFNTRITEKDADEALNSLKSFAQQNDLL